MLTQRLHQIFSFAALSIAQVLWEADLDRNFAAGLIAEGWRYK